LKFEKSIQLKAIGMFTRSRKKRERQFLFEMAYWHRKTTYIRTRHQVILKTENARRVLFLVDRLNWKTRHGKHLLNILKPDYSPFIYKDNKSDWHKADIVVTTIHPDCRIINTCCVFSYDFDLIISDLSLIVLSQ